MTIIEKSFYKSINKKFLFEYNPKIVVAVSGGPDSIALVFLLKKWIKKNKGTLTALIVDHQIRKDSFKEADYVKRYLIENNIHSKVLKVSKKNAFKIKMSQARENRYSKIIKYCKKNNIFHLFIGHHHDDNIETFLLRKIAGSNFEGLKSIQEKTVYKGIQIIRPLLDFSKSDIFCYLRKMNLQYVQDPSNKDEAYTRVAIRTFLKLNSGYQKQIYQDFKMVKHNYNNYIKMIFQIFHLTNYAFHKNMIIFDSSNFLKLDKEIQTKFIEISYKFFNPNKPFLRYKKIIKILDELCNVVEQSLHLANIRIRKKNNLIYLYIAHKC